MGWCGGSVIRLFLSVFLILSVLNVGGILLFVIVIPFLFFLSWSLLNG
jgi:hypothetical protein